jgi:hypothetical protein
MRGSNAGLVAMTVLIASATPSVGAGSDVHTTLRPPTVRGGRRIPLSASYEGRHDFSLQRRERHPPGTELLPRMTW